MQTRRDQRSQEAVGYRKLYSSARWRAIRAAQLAAEPLCWMCMEAGRVTAADTCDHAEPHKGDPVKFWSGPFRSLCASCHSRHKQSEERGGKRRPAISVEGWPM